MVRTGVLRMATLTPLSPSISGGTFSPASAAAGGDQFANPRGTALLYVKNGGGSSINVTLTAQITTRPADGAYPSMTVANNVVAVAAGAEKVIGPIPSAFNDGNGNVQVTYSAVTSVTVGVVQPA